MEVVGIMLVRNEDLFVERAIRNALEFCDRFLIFDHLSDDGTPGILARIVEEFPGKVRVMRVRDSGDSHRVLEPFAGSATWVFAVDGDEIYDAAGLMRLRGRLEAGEFSASWVVFGNVLNVVDLDLSGGLATGHLAPPCRSMTKLYNFAAIDSWTGRRMVERLHGGDISFRAGFDAGMRRNLHEEVDWDGADFRCLHLCFLKRSSRDSDGAAPRKNLMDRHAWSVSKTIASVREAVTGKQAENWKAQKYARGPAVTLPVGEFFGGRG